MSLSVALFIGAPLVTALIATAVISRYAPMEESGGDNKKRSPKRAAQGATVDESLAVSRAMERRQELAPAGAALGTAIGGAGAVMTATGPVLPARRVADDRDPEERFADLVPPEFREDFSQLVDNAAASD